jgi:hypothetical protein
LDETALVEEYRTLRIEIGQRVQFQMLVMGGIVALSTVLIPIAVDRVHTGNVTPLLAAPIVFAVTAWLYFEQDIFITQAASYLNQDLAVAVRSRLSPDRSDYVMRWERRRNEMLFSTKRLRRLMDLMFGFRLLATLGPGATSFVVACGLVLSAAEPIESMHWWDWVLVAADLIVIAFLAWLSRYVLGLYRAIDS